MALQPDDVAAELRHRPLLADCERCSARPQRPGESNGADDVASDNASRHACVFCQETSNDSYVPIHFLRARSRGLEDGEHDLGAGAAELLRDESNAFIDGSIDVAPYTEAFKSHRGCAACWKKWEMRQVQLDQSGGLVVKCPVCNLAVDIRKTYGDILCRSCQKAVVARGGNWKVWMGQQIFSARSSRRCQAGLALTMLCMFFGLQSLFSVVFWEICQASIREAANNTTAGRYPIGSRNPLDILLEPWLSLAPANASNATRQAGRTAAAVLATIIS